MVVVLENANQVDALRQPFLASLARRGATLTHYSAIAHPSQPNYIAMVAGSTLGVTSDANTNVDARQIGDLVEARGLEWKVYAEGYPGNCFLGAASRNYVRKHVAFLSFKGVQGDPARCGRIVDGSQMVTDVRTGKLPALSFYIPDIKDDGHDTGVAYADHWLSQTFGPLLADSRFTKGLLLVVTFDEAKRSLFGDNRVATILVGDAVKPGVTFDGRTDHYALLRLIEERLGLGGLGEGDAAAAPIVGIWR